MVRCTLICMLVCVAVSLAAVPEPRQTAKKESSRQDWFIDPSGRAGAIRRTATRADLVRTYGPGNVQDGPMDIGEGETVPATFLFPSDPKRRIAIFWENDARSKGSVRVQIDGDASLWHTTGGITLGTPLKKLEQLNGRPFMLEGFNWDYSGTVTSWRGGKLDSAFEPRDHSWRVVLRLSPVYADPNHVMSPAEQELIGEREFHSSHPEMQKLNPVVYQILWLFQSGDRPPGAAR